MFNFAGRNLKIYYRQKSAVFFSLLGVFIIIGLYVVFLGDVWVTGFELPGKEVLMYSWIIAGIVSVSSITTAMGAFGSMVEDRERKNSKDFFSSPVKRSHIVGGYLLSAYIIGVTMSILSLILGELYILLNGGTLLSFISMLKALIVILLSSAASSSFVFFIVSFFKNNNAFNTASTILGTLIGFLTGIYLPIGSLSKSVQWLIKLFPVSHGAALMRQILMETPIQSSFVDVPVEILMQFKVDLGIAYTYGNTTAGAITHVLVLSGTAILFFLLALINVSRETK
jgi:ABC-2 type transporter.